MRSVNSLSLPDTTWAHGEAGSNSCRRVVLEQYDREHISLRRYLLSIGMDSSIAEELVQESFLRLHEHLLGGGDQTNLRAWLYRVAHNLARNVQSSPHLSRTGPLSVATEHAEPASRTVSAEVALIERERNRKLNEAMSRLGGRERGCLLLRSQGLRYREIADILHLSTSTVAEHVRRGLESLKEWL